MGKSMTSRFPIVTFSNLEVQKWADTFAILSHKSSGQTRDGKPYLTCRFRDRRRELESRIWSDSPTFSELVTAEVGSPYKLRAILRDHEKYGLQLDVQQIRPVVDTDTDDGFRLSELFDQSRLPANESFTAIQEIATKEIEDLPLRQLVLNLLDAHQSKLCQLPATVHHYYPFRGGWLEHTLSVVQICIWLVDRYRNYYAEMVPPLNRDVLIAGAILHEIGRLIELNVPDNPLETPSSTVDGQLFGHHLLGRDMIRMMASQVPELDPERLRLLEHLVLSYLTRPEWGSPRLPQIPEALILHHADDLDAKMEMYIRCLTRDTSDGAFTAPDAILKKPLWKSRTV
jgi:3'-5' exoribonuclease